MLIITTPKTVICPNKSNRFVLKTVGETSLFILKVYYNLGRLYNIIVKANLLVISIVYSRTNYCILYDYRQ